MTDINHLFNDETMQRFLVDGYVVVKADLSSSVHNTIHKRLEEMFATYGNLGNNVLPLIPEIHHVFNHPAVHGALTSILGSGYIMNSHRYCHCNPPNSAGQEFHKDSYEGDEEIKHHRCRWAMAFYYPQDTTVDMGPSAILPKTQYYDNADAAHEQQEVALFGEAGTVAIIHYDLWHRATQNKSDKQRYMLKFLFERMVEPTRPSWRNIQPQWIAPKGECDQHQKLYEELWRWNCGTAKNSSQKKTLVENLIATLHTGHEPDQLNAAYELGTLGPTVLPPLEKALRSESETISRHAAYALSAVGSEAVPSLVAALADDNPLARAHAAYGLSDLGTASWIKVRPAMQRSVTEVLTDAIGDNVNWVRRNAAEALGNLGSPTVNSISALSNLLNDEEFWIRDNAARALAKTGPAAEGAIDFLVTSLNDDNRYVRFHAGLALRQIGTPAALNAVFDTLTTSRWCPLTSPASSF